MYDHQVDIFVKKSKTYCYRKGNYVIISRLDSLQCPVKILSCYLRETQIELASDMYIFRPISFLAHLTLSELLPSLGVRRPSVINSIFFQRTTEANETKRGRNVHLHGLTKCCNFRYDLSDTGGHNFTQRPYGKYVKQTSSQEPLNGLDPCMTEMFLTRLRSIVVTFCSDRLSNMAASDWLKFQRSSSPILHGGWN